MSVLVCENVTYNHGSETIIKNFNYNFLENHVYGVIGRKNSGKTILLSLLAGYLEPTQGQIYLDGKELFNNIKMYDRICFIPTEIPFSKHLRVSEVLKVMANYYPKWDRGYAHFLLKHFNIDTRKTIGKLDKHEKSLLLGIIGLASRANITIIDNPVDKADAKDRYDFFDFLYNHLDNYPRTFILTTDYIDEIDFVIDTVLFIDDGKLIDVYKTEEIKENFVYLTGKSEVLKSLITGIKVIGVEERGNMLSVCIRQKLTKDDIRKYKKYLIKISEVPIQKVFIHLINLRDIKKLE